MIKNFFVIIFCLLAVDSFAQFEFEKGYFINNQNQKKVCLIQDRDWLRNPNAFKYKESENSRIETKGIESVKEFSVPGKFKYKRYHVLVDQSPSQTASLSNSVEPEFEEMVLFLKVLVEGNASLFEYQGKMGSRYFFQRGEGDVLQLIYKKYKSGKKVRTNPAFRNQLLKNLECKTIDYERVRSLNYKKDDLMSFFEDFNNCTGGNVVVYEQKREHDVFNLSIRPGINYTTFYMEYTPESGGDYDFGAKAGLRIGVEAEYVLPFNKNKWAIIFEPSFQYFRVENSTRSTRFDYEVDYGSIDFPLGLRHYFFLKDDVRLFLNGVVLFKSIELNDQMNHPMELNLSSGMSFAAGAGFLLKDKYSLEVRYGFNRDVLNYQVNWDGKYKMFSLVVGYKIF